MKNEPTYSEAFSKLKLLLEELENGGIQLDKLASTVEQANELIAICEERLRSIETDLHVLPRP
ncbi:MAG: exodeoxyribonuclease VII small subunit [Bacteroidota bacterium]